MIKWALNFFNEKQTNPPPQKQKKPTKNNKKTTTTTTNQPNKQQSQQQWYLNGDRSQTNCVSRRRSHCWSTPASSPLSIEDHNLMQTTVVFGLFVLLFAFLSCIMILTMCKTLV